MFPLEEVEVAFYIEGFPLGLQIGPQIASLNRERWFQSSNIVNHIIQDNSWGTRFNGWKLRMDSPFILNHWVLSHLFEHFSISLSSNCKQNALLLPVYHWKVTLISWHFAEISKLSCWQYFSKAENFFAFFNDSSSKIKTTLWVSETGKLRNDETKLKSFHFCSSNIEDVNIWWA